MNDEEQAPDEERTSQEEQDTGAKPVKEEAGETDSGDESGEQSTGPANNTWIFLVLLAVLMGLVAIGFTSNRSPAIEALSATPTPQTVGETIYFYSSVDMGPDQVENYRWTFDDGTTVEGSDMSTTSHTYSEPGDYTVTLKVSSGRDATKTETTLVTVEDQLEVVSPSVRSLNAVPDNGGYPLEVSFQADARGNSAPIETYQWDFQSDGEIDRETASPNTTYTFERPEPESGQITRFYTVTLTVVDADGNSSQASVGIDITE